MSNYYYKDINLNNIYVNDGKTTTNTSDFYGYEGIPNSNSNDGIKHTGEAPVPFGFTYQGIDLSAYTTSNYTLYTTSQEATIPTGCKSIRVISVGGGGGGGGAGGNASATVTATPLTAKGNGGAGLDGGYATIVYSNNNLNENYDISNTENIYVTVGDAGTAGNNGKDNSTETTPFENRKDTTGGKGGSGNAGNSSYIKTTDSNGNLKLFEAASGNGGAGGNGAYATAGPTGVPDSDKGKSNTDFANLENDPYSSTLYKKLIFLTIPQPDGKYFNIPYGAPGSGAFYNEEHNLEEASSGVPGAVKIIWLYD